MNRFKIFLFSQILVLLFLGIAFSIFGVPNFFGEPGISEIDKRVLEDKYKEIIFTGSIISQTKGEKGRFLVKNEFGKEFIAMSKNLDLNNFLQNDDLNKKFFLEGEIFFDKKGEKIFNVKKISKIEEKIFQEPKKFFLENKFGGYGFEVDENIFTAVKGGSKTFLKNGSGEVILKFFSFDFKDIDMVKGGFFSEGGVEYEIQTSNGIIYGEVKNLKNGQDIFLKNNKHSSSKDFGVLIQIDYGKVGKQYLEKKGKNDKDWKSDEINLNILKREISGFLKSFYFIEKESISKEKCGGKENILCKKGYFCELFSTSKNANGRCVKL